MLEEVLIHVLFKGMVPQKVKEEVLFLGVLLWLMTSEYTHDILSL